MWTFLRRQTSGNNYDVRGRAWKSIQNPYAFYLPLRMSYDLPQGSLTTEYLRVVSKRQY